MKKISEIANGAVPVYETTVGEAVVYGSELYRGLLIKTSYSNWIQRRLKDCEAIENEDYYTFLNRPELSGKIPHLEHMIRLNVAKKIVAIENDNNGGF